MLLGFATLMRMRQRHKSHVPTLATVCSCVMKQISTVIPASNTDLNPLIESRGPVTSLANTQAWCFSRDEC